MNFQTNHFSVIQCDWISPYSFFWVFLSFCIFLFLINFWIQLKYISVLFSSFDSNFYKNLMENIYSILSYIYQFHSITIVFPLFFNMLAYSLFTDMIFFILSVTYSFLIFFVDKYYSFKLKAQIDEFFFSNFVWLFHVWQLFTWIHWSCAGFLHDLVFRLYICPFYLFSFVFWAIW